MKWFLALCLYLCLTLFVGGCQHESVNENSGDEKVIVKTESTAAPDQSAVARIFLKGPKMIVLNGRGVNLDELDKALAEIKHEDGTVWVCYNLGPTGDPTPAFAETIQDVVSAINRHQLASEYFNKPCFNE